MTEDDVKTINLSVELGPQSEWKNLQRRIAARVVSAYMIAAPDLGRHRRAIIRKLLDGDHSPIKLEAVDQTTAELAQTIRRKIKSSASLVRNYTSPRAQRGRLHFDPGLNPLRQKEEKKEKGKKKKKRKKRRTKMYGAEIKDVLVAGMVVLTFDWADRLGHPIRLQDVKQFLKEKGAAAFWGNEVSFYKSGIEDAWRNKRDVGHLCAALVVFMENQRLGKSLARRRFTKDEEEAFIRDIGYYLGCVKWFEGVMKKVSDRAHATMEIRLRPLPSSIKVEPVAHGGVPTVPTSFSDALDQWLASPKA